MPNITFILANGELKKVAVAAGVSLMKAAIDGGTGGLDAECGGCLTCATCHVYIDGPLVDKIPAPSEEENVMLEGAAVHVRPTSRLSCQVVLSDELDGLVVELPKSQY
ncbi:2Fe-2S iron-sulfur cluster-binding protein [Noviherbaspirillum sedimenti]|uniref:Ferredoxin n=1 Tax=Noviherbaspirillum sedimenti TaxID=2320865 RepID=A0A3A3FWQ3_9BURK|nr:2Fe-2S iron-sulfur cluster-binding protein [Noviherbaspirillum sedimenti]RJG00658.1 ferredoxin [Noviherbaspirillum sedimenti]